MRVNRFGHGIRKRKAPLVVQLCSLIVMFVVALIVLPAGSRTAAQTSPPTADPATQNQGRLRRTLQPKIHPIQINQQPSQLCRQPLFRRRRHSLRILLRRRGRLLRHPKLLWHSLTPVAASSVPAESASPVAIPQPTGPQDEKQKAIFDSSVNLLKLASMLKAEVDKTTADQLSVPVVRKAGEIEQLAHKMRTQ